MTEVCYGRKIEKIRSNLGKNRFNNLRLAANRMTKRFLGSCLKNTIRSVINAVCFLLINPLGWLTLALVLGMIYIGELPTPVINAKEYVSANLAEYRARSRTMDKESDHFSMIIMQRYLPACAPNSFIFLTLF